MAITVTPNLTDISMCEATTGWAASGSLLLDTFSMVQGNGCLSDFVDATVGTLAKYTLPSSADMTDCHLYVWMFCSGVVETKANGGYRIYAETDASNYSLWYVGGNDTHAVGWQLFCVDINATRTSGAGTLDPSDITKVGVQFNVITEGPSVGKNYFNNVYWDAFRYGTGLTITSGASDDIDLEDIYDADNNSTYKWGVLTKSFGSYILQGKLTFGGTGSETLDFNDTNKIIVCPDNPFVADDFYGIEVLRGTGDVNFSMGTKSGDCGISGCLIKSAGTKKFHVDLSDTDNNNVQLYGCTFQNGGDIVFPPSGTNNEVISCSFIECDQVDPDDCETRLCNFINTTDVDAALLWNESIDIANSCFIGNTVGAGIEMPSAVGTPYDFTNLTFSANTYDVLNSSGSAITINRLSGSDPSTYEGSTVTFLTSVNIKITVQDINTDPIENAQVAVYKLSDRTELMNEDTTSLGVAEETYSGGATDIEVRVRKASSGATKYKNFSTLGSIGSNDYELLVTLVEDTINNATS